MRISVLVLCCRDLLDSQDVSAVDEDLVGSIHRQFCSVTKRLARIATQQELQLAPLNDYTQYLRTSFGCWLTGQYWAWLRDVPDVNRQGNRRCIYTMYTLYQISLARHKNHIRIRENNTIFQRCLQREGCCFAPILKWIVMFRMGFCATLVTCQA